MCCRRLLAILAANDVDEQKDVSAEQPGKRAELQALYERWSTEVSQSGRSQSK